MEESTVTVDALIFGGGVAGLWLLDELVRSGREALLIEAQALGAGQSVASQGILHGGIKYSLTGTVSGSAQAISEMPELWRGCLSGGSAPDLSAVRVRAAYCHLWQTRTFRSKLGMLGARSALRITPRTLERDERPAVLRACPGTVVRLDEQVIDPMSVLDIFRLRHERRLLHVPEDVAMEIQQGSSKDVLSIALDDRSMGRRLTILPGRVVLAAGAGNAALRSRFGIGEEMMQRRPLHMVMMRGDLPQLNGHCVDGARTRITVTSDVDAAERVVWQVGGQVSEDGVDMSRAELVEHARREVQACLPELGLDGVEWTTYRIDRAERRTGGGRRPEGISVVDDGRMLTVWPTKLVLAPHLARTVCKMMPKPQSLRLPELPAWRRPNVALPPWAQATEWAGDATSAGSPTLSP